MIQNAGLIDVSREEEIAQIRQKYGIRKARNSLARLFESEWNNIMHKLKKAVFTSGYVNQLFSAQNETISDPVEIMQSIVVDEYSSRIRASKEPIHTSSTSKTPETQKNEGFRPYDEELAELE